MKSVNATFGQCLDDGCTIYVYCDSFSHCHHYKVLDIEAMAAKYGRDHGSLHKDLIKLPWKCENCGGRKVTFRYQPGTKEYSYFTPVNTVEDFRKADEEKRLRAAYDAEKGKRK